MATQKQRSDATRAQLLEAFRTSFLQHGYEATTTNQVLAETGLSKGALYHHFRSKSEIIEALYKEESRGAIDRAISAVACDPSPLARLKGACLSWISEVRAPNVSKVLFEIGPSALGRQKAKDIEDAVSLRHIEDLVEAAVAAHELDIDDIKLAASFLNALVAEAALFSLRTGIDPVPMLDRAISGVLDGFGAQAS